MLFKEFGGIDAVPICLDVTDVDDIVETVVRIAPGVRRHQPRGHQRTAVLRDRAASCRSGWTSRCSTTTSTARPIVVLAALRNAARLTGRALGDLRAVVSGAGAAGVAVTTILREAGIGEIAVADRGGVLHGGRARPDRGEAPSGVGDERRRPDRQPGRCPERRRRLHRRLRRHGARRRRSRRWRADSIVFALANPHPEVHPDVALRHARVVATGRSDYPNQINNVLAFPGIFRGALSVRATSVTEGMKLAAAEALAAVVVDELAEDRVVPSPFDPRVAPAVAAAVAAAARRDGVARL